jgi:hypothetical protein
MISIILPCILYLTALAVGRQSRKLKGMWRRAAWTIVEPSCKKSFRQYRLQHQYGSSFLFSSSSSTSSSSSSSSSSIISSSSSNNGRWTAGAVLAAVLGGTMSARYLYNHALQNQHPSNSAKSPKRDTSKATVRIKQVPSAPKTISQADTKNSSNSDEDMSYSLQHVDAKQFASFVEQQRAILVQAEQDGTVHARETLHAELQTALQDVHDRVSRFADWYFAYPTTYKLLSLAMSSAVKHAVTFRKEQTLKERVSEDLQDYIRDKYLSIVLRPALTDPKIHRAFVASLEASHQNYQKTLQALDKSVQHFVANQAQPYLAAPPSASDVIVDLDWTAQLQKVQHVPIHYEKFPERTVVLVASGAAVGKLAGGATLGTAAKAVTAKLAAPFATKAAASAMGGKAVAGAASGAMLGGPLGGVVGTVAGAALGVGVDMGVNAGISLLHRGTLEEDLHDSIDATLLEWEERLWPELLQVQTMWYSHAKDILQAT